MQRLAPTKKFPYSAVHVNAPALVPTVAALADGREIKAGGKDYLLSPMRKQELAVLDEVLDRARGAVEMVLTQGVSAAMNEFNRRPADPEGGTDEPKGK